MQPILAFLVYALPVFVVGITMYSRRRHITLHGRPPHSAGLALRAALLEIVLTVPLGIINWIDTYRRQYKQIAHDDWINPEFSQFLDVIGPFILGALMTPIVALVTFIIALVLNRIFVPTGYCKCGYDLTGNVSGVCTECGTPVKKL